MTGEVQGIVGEYGTQFRLGLSGQEARHRGSGAQDKDKERALSSVKK